MKKTLIVFLTGFIIGAGILAFVKIPELLRYSWGPYLDIMPQTKQILVTLDHFFKKSPSQEEIQNKVLHAVVAAYDDPYTTYFSPDEVADFATLINGDFEGIGAYVEDSESGVFVTGVIPGSPAQEIGLLPGDLIQKVDGNAMSNKTKDEVVKYIRGPAGSKVTLDIFSSVLWSKKTVTLERKKLELPIIVEEMIGKVLYIHLASFNDHSGEDVDEVLKKYQGKFSRVLLDLRDNGGGTIESAVDVGSLFMRSWAKVASVDDSPNQYVSYGKEDFPYPLAVLVNWQTASAAEILASALHVNIGAPILGSRTFGKGSVQELFGLDNGGQLKITTSHWKTADDKFLDKVGIKPDKEMLPTALDITTGKDRQKEEAIQYINTEIKKKKE